MALSEPVLSRPGAGHTVTYGSGSNAELPPAQQTVIRKRDIKGYSAEEVCSLLLVSERNQRALLHCARSALERHLDG
jgi:DNA-directed RNA polymerase specialized sigma24 family protein